MKRFFTLLLWLTPFIGATAQVPSNRLGLNPLRLRWNQIHTDKVRVIFPEGLESQGQRVANVVHYLQENHRESIGDRFQEVNILLQNQTTIPNGFVTVGPFRSEFLVTPPQFLTSGPGDWIDMLAIHEYRHVQQFANTRRGITELGRAILGSWVWGGMAGTALPRWYWEGDAVGTETALTQAGRGRVPEFDMEYRALVLNDRIYGYEKASAGSLRDFVPDHYSLGYYLTTYARHHYDPEIWKNVVADAARYKGIFFPFSRSLNKRTGLRTPELYRATMQELDSQWTAKYETMPLSEAKQISLEAPDLVRNTFTSYRYPQYQDDGSVIAEKAATLRFALLSG
ncbi:MAG: hypothetical protein HC880_11820 [Bacteroidia bacterium]|nr:hypothetical protein [Bacteroidia bacterium]